MVNQGCRGFLSSQGLSIVNQGISESCEAFPMRSWFRAPGWFSNHFLLAGTSGSCPRQLGTSGALHFPEPAREVAWEVGAV